MVAGCYHYLEIWARKFIDSTFGVAKITFSSMLDVEALAGRSENVILKKQ